MKLQIENPLQNFNPAKIHIIIIVMVLFVLRTIAIFLLPLSGLMILTTLKVNRLILGWEIPGGKPDFS